MAEGPDLLMQYFFSLGTQMPLLVVYLLGFILAISWHARCSRPAVLTFVAISLMFFNTMVMTALQIWLPRILQEREEGPPHFQMWIGLAALVRSLINGVGLLLLLLAVFSAREPRSWFLREGPEGEQPPAFPEARTEKLP